MTVKNIDVQLDDLGGVVQFETEQGKFDSTFVKRSSCIVFGSGVDDARLTDADFDVVSNAVNQQLLKGE